MKSTIALVVGLWFGLATFGADKPWKHHAIDVGLSGGDGVRLHDWEGDGDLDVVVGWEQAGASRLYINPGATPKAKKLWPSVDVGPAKSIEDAVMADVDGDGRVDVISATEGGSAKLIVHFAPKKGDAMAPELWETKAFPKSLAGDRRWMFSTTFDVNGDGRLDIVSGGKSKGAVIAWFEAPAADRRDLSAWKFHKMSDVGWVMSLVAQDMDGDGDLDVIASDRRRDVGLQGAWWLENPATPHSPGNNDVFSKPWARHWISEKNVEAMFLRPHDMDGDGDQDVVVPIRLNELKENPGYLDNPSRLRWYERLDATGQNWKTHEIAYPANTGKSKGCAVGDITGDGRVDIVLSHASANAPLSGMVWLSYRDSVFDAVWVRHEMSGPNGSKFDRVELLDVDGDGDLDVMTTEENFGPKSVGLGAIWYENPTPNPGVKKTIR
jgi:hypothetical protein